ncbi:MAG TPA: pyridoxamine 5'-phosphate oxidase family protein [Methylophilus sp.]|uniref:pyridoxamine 5'-phosphate oxidase family protein n=1 Tax=Methylophilus sp. TaxID=29541 RepID=UPI002C01376A|nr:pyridoxamine 5'-phosphate oxidase family protein [Methylophilus sp.]HSH88308.1 pyridoxamine 5'-phosphate oxidase family protein [Methylophilus sp.]
MKIQPQTKEELTKLGELIEDFRIAMLTFIDGKGALVSQPMGPIEMDADGNIWFFTDSTSEKVQHLDELNLAFSGEPDGTYVSLSGYGELVTDQARKEELWSPFVKPWFPDGPDSANLALLKFIPDTAEYWDAPHSSVVRLFAMAASIVAARPIGMGDHERLNHL